MTETAETLDRKKVRAAHRASVTRALGQAREMLSEDVASETARLTQKREALASKAELLRRLDSEIVEAVHEDELEGEIEHADEIQEQIELMIIELDSALRLPMSTDPSGERARPYPRGSTTPERRQVEERETQSRNERGEREAAEGGHIPPSLARGFESDQTGSRPGIPCSPHVKLPKLSLKKFGGDVTSWTTFWDTFESAVHQNSALTGIDKFSYLNSLLESTAAEAVAGLALTSANYDEAVSTLKRRFGNKQAIINRHMELLLHLEAVTSVHDLKELRQLFDAVESNVRGLKALGVSATSYGGLLSPILMSRLPSDLRLIISRELSSDEWDVEVVMEIIQREIEARERSAGAMTSPGKKYTSPRPPPTALSLTTGASPVPPSCVYCGQAHPSGTCQTISDPEERKQNLRRSGRCFVCLRRNHVSRNCRSAGRCAQCGRRHHTSICLTFRFAMLPNRGAASTVEVRAILDTGSQRSYVTTRVREAIGAKTMR